MQIAHSLTRSQLRQLEAELHSELARLERSMAVTAAAEGVTPLVTQSRGTVPGGDPDGDLDLTVRSHVQQRHDAIRDALRRIDSGRYGICAGCQAPIPFGRLLVMPESERCVACGPI